MSTAPRWLLRLVVCGAFAAMTVMLSAMPPYRPLAPGTALVKVGFDHATARRSACERLSAAEQAALAPNMRRTETCPRERVDLRFELDVDGRTRVSLDARPAGLARDGEASVYATLPVAAGPHVFDVRLRDTARSGGFDHEARYRATLAAGEILVVGFDAVGNGFEFR